MPQEGWHYLHSFLAPFGRLLSRSDVTDLYVNKPGEVWIETSGGTIERHELEAVDASLLSQLVEQVAAFSHQGVNREHPLLSAALPDGSRVQAVVPPATRGHLALAIRKHVAPDLSLNDFFPSGDVRKEGIWKDDGLSWQAVMSACRERGDMAGMLRVAVRARRNILVSGGTSSGKTTFLNALMREIEPGERLITIEDTPELQVSHANSVGLLAVRGALGEAQVTADDLVSASLRMRPDRIILGELRGPEAYAFLRAINTGHPGSMATVHADSTRGAVEQLALLILQGGTRLSRQDILDYVRESIGVFVQLGRTGGRRHVVEVTCS